MFRRKFCLNKGRISLCFIKFSVETQSDLLVCSRYITKKTCLETLSASSSISFSDSRFGTTESPRRTLIQDKICFCSTIGRVFCALKKCLYKGSVNFFLSRDLY